MGWWERVVELEPPTVAGLDVHDAVYRLGDPSRLDAAERLTLIATANTATDGAIRGPEGFSLHARKLSRGATWSAAARAEYTALHVVNGTTQVKIAGGATHGTTRSTSLTRRDTALIAPGTAFHVAADDDGDATVLELCFLPPRTARTRTMGAPITVARTRTMVAVRDRFPVSLATTIHDILSPHTLHPVIGPVAHGPGRFEIVGPDELVVALATTPRGTGPALHVHRYSTEMFVVLEGSFRIYWGELGEHEATLGPLDAVVVPRGVNRAFEAHGAGDNWILPIVVGTNDETEDIVFFPEVARRLHEVGPKLFAALATATRIRIGKRVGAVR